ncbi:MAG: A/G-specific adenine glycosylase [Culicoidibacterales bacterium]
MQDKNFEKIVINWFNHHQRDLPWRKTQNPYYIWVSEIMLQQTQVVRVIDYYTRFLTAFPTIADLATAPQTQLLKAWEGLGYYSRVRNMQKAALMIMDEHGGEFPQAYEAILALPGIGSYTAGAISACAFGKAYPAVDGNVLRVLARIQADSSDISKASTKKKYENYLATIMTQANPSFFNQGLIELGALICTPTNPQCQMCPLQTNCQAYHQDRQDELPVKARKKPAQPYWFETIIFTDGEKIAMLENQHKGVLQHLWALPQIASQEHHDDQLEVQQRIQKKYHLQTDVKYFGTYKHIFSHQIWHMRVWLVEVGEVPKPLQAAKFIDQQNFLEVPMANSHRKIVTAFWGESQPQQVAEISVVY